MSSHLLENAVELGAEDEDEVKSGEVEKQYQHRPSSNLLKTFAVSTFRFLIAPVSGSGGQRSGSMAQEAQRFADGEGDEFLGQGAKDPHCVRGAETVHM